ncbi:MAG: hypothetical protein RMK50_05430, partial [Nitrososphaerota archaeon]|nr:hypothetical protein [Candidatus Bathyarchaeota archaeon]MDW8194242.1 hypothetical protein [Nitrososphaerota archaeon]
ALRRLGFKDKKRLGKGYVYKLTPEAVKDLAQRLNIHVLEENASQNSITENIINEGSESLKTDEYSKKLSPLCSLHSLSSLSSPDENSMLSSSCSPINEESKLDGKTVVAIHRVTSRLFPTEKCCLCGKLRVDFQADLADGSWKLLCCDCGEGLVKQLRMA